MSIKRISVLNLCHVLKPFVKSTPDRVEVSMCQKQRLAISEYRDLVVNPNFINIVGIKERIDNLKIVDWSIMLFYS